MLVAISWLWLTLLLWLTLGSFQIENKDPDLALDVGGVFKWPMVESLPPLDMVFNGDVDKPNEILSIGIESWELPVFIGWRFFF